MGETECIASISATMTRINMKIRLRKKVKPWRKTSEFLGQRGLSNLTVTKVRYKEPYTNIMERYSKMSQSDRIK